MNEEVGELDELSREIRKIIDNNKKFLERVMDEDFEPDEPASESEGEVFEEL